MPDLNTNEVIIYLQDLASSDKLDGSETLAVLDVVSILKKLVE